MQKNKKNESLYFCSMKQYFYSFLCIFQILLSPIFAQDNQQWILAGEDACTVEMLQIDDKGYWYVAGNFQKSLKIGNKTIQEDAGRYFVMKYEPSTKQASWIQQFEQPIRKISIGAEGLYLSGHFKHKFYIDTIQVRATGEYTSYVCQLNFQTGKPNWIQLVKASKDALMGGMCTDRQGNVFVTGGFVGFLEASNLRLRPLKFKNIYLAKYSPKGEILWLRQGTAGEDPLTGISVWDITTDYQGNAILAGTLSGRGFFDRTPINSSQEKFTGEGFTFNSDIFLAKYSPDGEVLWAKPIATQSEVQAIATDTLGSVYLTGNFRGSESSKKDKFGQAVFDQFKTVKSENKFGNQSQETFFTAKYSSLGNLIWVKCGESSGETRGTSLTWDSKHGILYVLGFFHRDFKIGNTEGIKSVSGDMDFFLTTFAPNGAIKKVQSIYSTSDKIVKGTSLNNFGELYALGLFTNDLKTPLQELKGNKDQICGFIVKLTE